MRVVRSHLKDRMAEGGLDVKRIEAGDVGIDGDVADRREPARASGTLVAGLASLASIMRRRKL